MKISLKLEYACRALAQMGRSYGSKKLLHIEDLARLERIPKNYLVQILNILCKSGILVSKRGKQGGYVLAKPPAEISLHTVVNAIEPDLLKSKTSFRGESGPKVAEIFGAISGRVSQHLKKTTLAALIANDNAAMYDI